MEQGLKIANAILAEKHNVYSIEQENGYDYIFLITYQDGNTQYCEFDSNFENLVFHENIY